MQWHSAKDAPCHECRRIHRPSRHRNCRLFVWERLRSRQHIRALGSSIAVAPWGAAEAVDGRIPVTTEQDFCVASASKELTSIDLAERAAKGLQDMDNQ